MSRDSVKIVIGFAIAAVLMGFALMHKEPYQGSIEDPVQINLPQAQTITIAGDKGNVDLSLLAAYTIEAVVQSEEKYSDDYPSQISSHDFALAWGDLNRKEIDETIKYSQSRRWYAYRYSKDCPVSGEYIGTHSANVHLIHCNQNILKIIKKIGENDHIKLEGYLVQANFKDGPWKSSLSRTDSGNGACEIMYVTNAAILD